MHRIEYKYQYSEENIRIFEYIRIFVRTLTHIRSIHENIKFPCQHCDYKATQAGSLKSHIQSIHENIKFPCQQCDYKATKASNLKTHVQSIHENIKFPCQHCDFKATQAQYLKNHVKSKHRNMSQEIFIEIII